jgi:methylamine--corrinoid protein Co-methyltransferase
MPDLLNYFKRALTGPLMSQEEFHLNVLIPNVRDITAAFDITYNPEEPVPGDNALADRLYAAAIEFLIRTGLYCADTNRVIRFDRAEIESGLNNYRQAGTFGEGLDRTVLTPRRPEDRTPPFCHIGTGIVATSEEIALAQVEGYAGVVQANSVSIPALGSIRGMPVISGSPLELYAVFSAIGTARKALRRAGRPGLPILNLCSSATTATGTIAGCYP